MTIDISKIRPGDRVTLVPLEVKSVAPVAGVMAVFMASGGELYATTDQIVAHHPAPREFQVGDRVRDRSHLTGEVIAIAEGYAMVRWRGSNVTATQCRYLTLVEGGE